MTGRVAVVTGGATGIGWGIASLLSRAGMRLAIVQPDITHAEEAASSLGEARGFAADIRELDAVSVAFEAIIETFGTIDVLVNNASITGLPAVGPFLSTPPDRANTIVDTNLKGTIWCSQIAAREMIRNGSGSIVNIASVGAFAAQEFASIYSATKAAQVMLTKAMALELAPHGIRVNAIAPGDIFTPASADIGAELKGMGATGDYWRRTPMGRRGSPEDIAEAVAFLVSEKAGFITGAVLQVDGGFLTY